MIESTGFLDPAEEILVHFQAEFDAALDKEAVVGRYCSAHRELAPRIRALADMVNAMHRCSPEAESDPVQPERLGEFRIIRRLEVGGMGEVYEAEQERLKRRVAVKVIRRGRISPENRERFLREQRVLAHLHQTHIVPIHTAGEEGPLQYFAMPFIEGAALHHVLTAARKLDTSNPGSKTPTLASLADKWAADQEKKKCPTDDGDHGQSTQLLNQIEQPPQSNSARQSAPGLSPDYFRSVAQVMADAAEALQHAHNAHILHRDIKPSNLMVDKSGQCWMIDFGLACYLNGQAAMDPASATANLRNGPATVSGIMGTPNYMAPEQFEARADVTSDVWGLGATLYELLTLRQAFPGKDITEIKAKVLSNNPVSPRHLIRSIPPDLAEIAMKAVNKDSASRYQTAHDFWEDLRRWLRHEPTRARPAGPARRLAMWAKRNKGWAVALAITLIAIPMASLLSVLYFERRAAASEFEAEVALTKTNASEDRERAKDRELSLQKLEQFRLAPDRANGWSKDSWDMIRALANENTEDRRLGGQAAATLIGIDARPINEFKFEGSSVAFDPDGKRLLISEPGKGIHIWDESIGEAKLLKQAGAGGTFIFRPNGGRLQLVPPNDDASSLVFWDLTKQQVVQRYALPPAGKYTIHGWPVKYTIHAWAAAQNGSFVAASGVATDGKGILTVWDVTTGKPLFTSTELTTDLAFSMDGSLLAVGDNEGRITIRTMPKGDVKATLRAQKSAVTCLAFGHDPLVRLGHNDSETGWILAAGDAGSLLTIWDVGFQVPRSYCLGSADSIYAVEFSPDGMTVASAGRGMAKLWDVATGHLLLNLGSRNWMTGLAFSPDGKKLAVASRPMFGSQGRVDVWELENGRGHRALRGHSNQITKVALSPDGRRIAGLADNWRLAVWDRQTGFLLNIFEVPSGYSAGSAGIAFNGDGTRLAFAAGESARLWDVATGKTLKEWALPPGFVDRIAFHSSGKLLLMRCETLDEKAIPLSPNHPAKYPRVCRLRDLLAPEPLKPIAVIKDFNWHVFHDEMATDGSFFAIEGLNVDGKNQNHWVKSFDGPTGAELWPNPVKWHEHFVGGMRIEANGKLLKIHPEGANQPVLVEARTGKFVGSLFDSCAAFVSNAEGTQIRYWVGQSSKVTSGMQLYRNNEEIPLVSLGLNIPAVNYSATFDSTGTHLFWGNQDGSVTDCDLLEIRKRLTELHLGW